MQLKSPIFVVMPRDSGTMRKALAHWDSSLAAGLRGDEEVQQICEQLKNLLRFPILLNLWNFLD